MNTALIRCGLTKERVAEMTAQWKPSASMKHRTTNERKVLYDKLKLAIDGGMTMKDASRFFGISRHTARRLLEERK